MRRRSRRSACPLLGNLTETVEVTAEAPLVLTATGERSAVVAQQTVQNTPVSNTFFAEMVALTPGVNSTVSTGPTRSDNTGNVATTNYMLDGVTDVNTGGNQPGINLNFDPVAEVKVLTQSYQAEYGRSSGLQVIGITKSGTDQFHGSLYDYDQHSGWNTNSWANDSNGVHKAYSLTRFWGGTLGGPVGKPGRQHKLFWFISEQVQPSRTGGASLTSVCGRRSKGRVTSRKPPITTAISSTPSRIRWRMLRALPPTRPVALPPEACWASFRSPC